MTDKTIDAGLKRVFSVMKRTGVAKKLGITKQAVSNWKRCPPERVQEVSSLTGVPDFMIRPDICKPEKKPAKRRVSASRR